MLYAEKQEPSTLLELHHEDYSLYMIAPTQLAMRRKAVGLIGDEALKTEYRWSEGARLFVKDNETGHEVRVKSEEDGENVTETALFFENTEYQVEVAFDKPERIENVKLIRPIFTDENGKEEKRDNYMQNRGILSFSLNYGNDIGQSDIKVSYEKDGKLRSLFLHFDVMSTKLDYHKDLRCILQDIEREYTMLSLSFLRKTYHTFAIDANAKETPDLIWWNIFKDIQEEFCRAVSKVIDSPHNRLRVQHEFRRADQLRHVSPMLANEWMEHKEEEKRMYRTEEWVLNDDTIENRFVKFALNNIREKFQRLRTRIIEEHHDKLPDHYKKEIDGTSDTLTRLSTAPFLRRIGRFTGLKGENLTLKQASGYSTVYRDWLLLQSIYDLHDGIQSMELKDIATLYEIWCFIEVKNIVRELVAEDRNIPLEEINQFVPDNTSDVPMSYDFVRNLDRGEKSKIILKNDDTTLAEVIYNAQFGTTDKENAESGLGENVRTLTVEQRPDIVLRLTKANVEKGIEMTYLFDAKYRIDPKNNAEEIPPEDAINQMHRYRDAIYYSDLSYEEVTSSQQLKREIIGGYILFPGKDPKNPEKTNYLKSIDKVNIGAFPLRPDPDGTKDSFLRNFLKGIISKPRREVLMESIPQRGLFYTDEPVDESYYFLSTIDRKVNDNVIDLLKGVANVFVSGYATLTAGINLQQIKHLAIVDRHKVRGVYKVEEVSVVDKSDKLEEAKSCDKNRKYRGYEQPYRIQLQIAEYMEITEFTYGIGDEYKGRLLSRGEFEEYLEGKYEKQGQSKGKTKANFPQNVKTGCSCLWSVGQCHVQNVIV